jgi:hypothetical protein
MHLAPLGSSAVKHPDAFGAGPSLGGRFSNNQRRIAALQSLFVSYIALNIYVRTYNREKKSSK